MKDILELVNQMSPYILLGFLLAGLMHAFVPNDLYRRHLGHRSVGSIIKATLLGVPLPLCSCGVIPTAMSLRKEGASKAATISFLIATPQTGVDSIIATYSLMGLPFALLRPIAAIVTALTGGLLAAKLCKEDGESRSDVSEKSDTAAASFGSRMMAALKYAFVDMMQDIGKWLVAGLAVAGIITVFVPESFFELFAHSSLLSMLFVLLLAIPMYLCATGSIPIAVALMLKGLSPGTALVLLMAGPAVNTASMLVVGKVMGRRTLLVYLFSIIAGAMAMGLCIDHLLPREWFLAPLQTIRAHSHEGVPFFNTICSALLVALLINAFLQRRKQKRECHCVDCSCNTPHKSRTTFIVEGMACNHCKASVERALKGVEGVESVSVELSGGRCVVEGIFDNEEAVKAVEGIGFSIVEEKN